MPSPLANDRSRPARFTAYPGPDALVESFRRAAVSAGGRECVVGASVEGRPLVRYDLGTAGRRPVLMTALMHGIEVVGALALLDILEKLGTATPESKALLAETHIVVLPIVNPDAFASNMSKIAVGKRAWQRCNAHGVDLNRNFPRLTTRPFRHPFSGSRFRFSPHYLGPHSLSEPESRAVHAVAMATRPALSLAFHSFGNLLLYPWAYTARENERAGEYRALAAAMTEAQVRSPYRLRQARQLYPVLGDMDDWLDAALGTLAFTVEVSRPDVGLLDGRHLLNPFCWMNPGAVRKTVDDLTPGVLALVARAAGLARDTKQVVPKRSLLEALEIAAK